MKTSKFIPIGILFLIISSVDCRIYLLLAEIVNFLLELTRIQPLLFPQYQQSSIRENVKFDFIIVGASPSGSVVANRLTENPDVNVLLLEAGEEPSFITDVPFVAGFLEFTSYNYGYKSVPQEGFCKGCIDKNMELFHGKALGGSSIINYMLFIRGNPKDFDTWADLGNPGWSYKDMLSYLKKLEDARVEVKDSQYRGEGGPLTVSDIPYRTKSVHHFVNACIEADYDYVDYNGRKQIGVSYVQGTIRDGARCSAEKAYLRPIRNRKNLVIQTNSKVTKILMNKYTKTVFGVEYLHNGEKHEVFVEKEVILSAGVFNSPQLLMLSGIGPKDHLEEIGIPLIKDLPVGKKMYDHAAFPAVIYELNSNAVIDLIPILVNPKSYIEYSKGTGPFTNLGGCEAIAYINTNTTKNLTDIPNIELLMLAISFSTDFGIAFRKIFNIPSETFDILFGPLIGKNVYQVIPTLIYPKSFGWIELNKKDPEGAPLLYSNYFSDPDNDDIKTLIQGIREIERINSMPSMQKLGAKMVVTPVPGCEHYKFDSDDYWECALRTLIASYYHQVATCKMGPKSDPETVVNHKLKVHGIKKLRVIDNSIIPTPPASHTVAMAYAIGEKGADLIKSSWNL
ncbi:glucose dehydrogenase [FAD, quinone]-like [Diorhabda carinulata]|uniref:glucose dehydrogenase [FAD, quinone]-like n=1 Tax=Diorhabda carinulata TaxID=1163345 RepID=UPI0025A1D3D9|nr:glucose dehydrogenase [FAD, quinone]-like [Diorhabda carinulata]